MNNVSKKCLNCNESFSPKNPKGKFCSDKCRVYYSRKNKNKKKGGPKPAKNKLKFAKSTKKCFVGSKSSSIKMDEVGRVKQVVLDLTKPTHQVKNLSEPRPTTNYIPNAAKKSPPAGLSKSETLKWMREHNG